MSDKKLCDVCDGLGYIKNKGVRDIQFNLANIMCDKCHGIGQLDWIEMIVGRKDDSAMMEEVYSGMMIDE